MSGIQVKSYLFPAQAKPTLAAVSEVEEIRRFNLSLSDEKSGLYQSLIGKIQQAYGTLLPNKEEIRTYWQDDEDELIGFTSDNELQYAIDVMTALKVGTPYEKNMVFKVYVARKSVPDSKQSQQERKCKWQQAEGPQVHFGVVCDACEGPVVGNRYKCSVCADYDLCEECNGKDLHKEHVMNKITRPLGCMFGGQRRGAWKNRGGACGPKGYAAGNEKRCHQNGPFQQFMKDFGGLPQYAAGNMPFVSDPEQLKSFGENLKKILDPLGIDVSYYVDVMTTAGKDKSKTEEAKTAEAKKKDEEAKTAEAKKKKEEAKTTASTTSSTTTTTTTTTSQVTEPAATEETIRRSESIMDESLIVDNTEPIVTPKTSSSIQIDTASTSKAGPVETAELIDLSKSVNPMAPYESAINALKTVSAAYESSESQSPSAPAVDSMMVDDFNLVDIADELKIIKTIETLKTMGYSDDGGWLTRLVSAKAGNINKVLDAISPNRSQ